MIRVVLRLGFVALGLGWLIDRILRLRARGAPPAPIESLIVIDAPIERVWSVVADIEGQPRWMHDMKSVRMTTDPPVRVGSRGEATVRVFGVGVTDPVTITEFEPPTRFAVRHEGTFTGRGVMTLERGPDGTTTIVRWQERLEAPVFRHAAAVIMAPVFGGIFQADLERLRQLVEAAG